MNENFFDKSGYIDFNKYSLANICKKLRKNNKFNNDWNRKREFKNY